MSKETLTMHKNFKKELKDLLNKYNAELDAWSDDGYMRMIVCFPEDGAREHTEVELTVEDLYAD